MRDDAAGDVGQIANGFTLTITTGAYGDNTPPTINTKTPTVGATGIALGTTVNATFSEPMNATTISSLAFTLQAGATAVPATVAYSAASLTATLTPNSALTSGTTYTATVKSGASGVKDLAGNPLSVNVPWTFTTVVGGGPVTQTVSNTSFITIRDKASASLYPAPVTISGMTGAITKVVVTVKGLTHAFARDIDMLLVGPGNQKSIVMSDTIGNRAISNLTMTFDATAVNAVPADAVTGSGTYKPTDITFGGTTDNFNITPPAGGTAGPAAPYTANVGVFTGLSGTSLNGVWKLYVLDDGAADTGSISGGWTLAVTAQ